MTAPKINCIDNKAHDWKPARFRGTKVRHQCTRCLKMDGWTKNPEAVQTAKAVAVDWTSKTVADLRSMCKDHGVTGYSKMKRDDLITALESA